MTHAAPAGVIANAGLSVPLLGAGGGELRPKPFDGVRAAASVWEDKYEIEQGLAGGTLGDGHAGFWRDVRETLDDVV